VLLETEFAPLPIFTEFIVPSTGKAGPPAKVNKSKKALFDVFLSCIIFVEVLAKYPLAKVVLAAEDPELFVAIACKTVFISALTLAPVELSIV
jgi:hypothetical protein